MPWFVSLLHPQYPIKHNYQVNQSVPSHITQLINQHVLPKQFELWVDEYFRPLAQDIAGRQQGVSRAYVLGIQGTQGSGKSTISEFLKVLLEKEHNLTCAVLSIDDFYFTLKQRMVLANSIHPLLKTRGVPGTHDIPLAMAVLGGLKDQKAHENTPLPRFNKANDDRHGPELWGEIAGKVDVIIFEGWCVGLPPQDEKALSTPCNDLEKNEDSKGLWRSYVNNQLAESYQTLFSLIDDLLVLQAPSFDVVYEWRLLQEQKLINSLQGKGRLHGGSRTLDNEKVKRFISHYQRLTEHALNCLPARASWVLYQNAQHQFTKMVTAGKK